jgi:hypothetical protein
MIGSSQVANLTMIGPWNVPHESKGHRIGQILIISRVANRQLETTET